MTAKQIGRLRERGVIERLANGVYRMAGSPQTWRQRTMAATSSGRSIAIGECAAILHDIDGATCQEVVVAVEHGFRHPLADRAVQVLHTYSAADVTVVDGIPCAGLARTICDIGWLAPHMLSRGFDDYQRRGFSLAWVEQTAARLESFHLHGLHRVHREIETRRNGGVAPESWFERLVEQLVRTAAVGAVVRQYEVRAEDGRFVARVDLAIPEIRLAIEAHSRRYHTGPQREAFDQRRDNRLAEVGWETLYVGWSDASVATVAQQIRAIARRRAADLGIRLAG
jgi:very-short-patch-repair endonuclease